MTDQYLVVRLFDQYPLNAEEIVEFENAEDVSSYMWGRHIGKHIIYKNGVHASLSYLYPDVFGLREYLENFSPY